MGGHGGSHRGGSWPKGHRVSGLSGPGHGVPGPFPGGGYPPGNPPPRPRPVVWAAALATVGVWSLLAWGAYGLVDGGLAWFGGNAAVLAERGRGLAGAVGAGREFGAAVEGLNTAGALGALRSILKPLIVVVWAAGAVALLAAPLLLARLAGRMGFRGRH